MQIPLANSAANAASIASQATAKNNNVAPAENPAASPAALSTDVEKTEESNKDRDAQGQGDGLGDRGSRKPTPEELATGANAAPDAAPQLPGEEPHRLDVLG